MTSFPYFSGESEFMSLATLSCRDVPCTLTINAWNINHIIFSLSAECQKTSTNEARAWYLLLLTWTKNTKKIKLRWNKKSPAWKYQPGQLEGGKRLMSHEQKRPKKNTQAIKVQLAPSVSYTEIRHRFIHKILHTW